MAFDEVKALIEQQGKAFEVWKDTFETEMKSKLGKDDPVLTEKLARIEKSLDDAVEAKAKIEAAVEGERKEREDLEMRMNKLGVRATGEAEAKQELELKEFNLTLQGLAGSRSKKFEEVDADGMAEYKSALNHMMRHGKDDLSPEEVKTLSAGSDPDGGYFVTPDTSGRIVKKIYETSPARQVFSVQSISTDKLEGIEDLGEAGAGYAGETSQGSDTTTPQVGKWEILTYWLDTEPKATQQLLDDASVNIEMWLSDKVSDKLGRFENTEFIAGATGKIRGLTSYATAADSGSGVTWGTMGHVLSGASGAFASSSPADKIHDLVGALKDFYLTGARFMTRRAVITAVRKFKDGQGQYLWQPSMQAGEPERLVGYPIVRAEDMPALASGSLSLAFGDFAATYQIVDRIGIRVLRDPYTSKPYVKFYTTKRTGGGVVNFEATKFMKFSGS